MKKIKVMYFFSGIISGGAEQVILNYCKYLDKDIYDFIAVYQHEPIKECLDKFTNLGFETVRITARSENLLKSIKDTCKIIKEFHPDIIHTNMNLMNFIPLSISKIYGINGRISHSHICEKDKSFIYRCIASICKSLTCSAANVYLACGEDAGKYLYGNRKYIILNNAIDIDDFNFITDNYRERYSLHNKIIIGHAGRFTHQKNHKRVIDIFAQFHKSNNDSVLLLAGEGELKKSIIEYVHEKGLDDSVIFLGIVKNMCAFYSAIDLFLFPSLYEGLPVVALEVQAAGKPILMSDKIDKNVLITSLADMLSLEKNNNEWSNKMTEMIRRPKSSNYKIELTEAGYNVKKEANKLDGLYTNLLGAS